MLICKHLHLERTTSFVDLNLDWKMLVKLHLFVVLSMEGKQVDVISGIISVHVCTTWDSNPVRLIQMYGCALQSNLMAMNIGITSFYTLMMLYAYLNTLNESYEMSLASILN